MNPSTLFFALALLTGAYGGTDAPPAFTEVVPGLGYTNPRVASEPWSIHVVRMDRLNPAYTLQSLHAQARAVGLSSLSEQVRLIPKESGLPLAAVNGDFYQRERAYAGDPRGLQISHRELLSAPVGGVAFWLDAAGQPHATNVAARFQVTWPDGSSSPFGLNEERTSHAAVLYTPAFGASTYTVGGRELVLEPQGSEPVGSLRIGDRYSARVREIRDAGDTALAPGAWVLSLGNALLPKLPRIEAGVVLQLSTTTVPDLRGATMALSGGPLLLRDGKRQTLRKPASDSYEFSSMFERHPRSAIGWNRHYFFLVEVDGRQRGLSVGMTLEELADYLRTLGCEDAMNLDGGGSATLWYAGKVRNSPCDGHERPIANSLVVLMKAPASPSPSLLSTNRPQ